MIIFVCGDTHGQLDSLYKKVETIESQIETKADVLLHTGSFGFWPDWNRLDRETRRREKTPDFHTYYLEKRPVPLRTYSISGSHEDHQWIKFMHSKCVYEFLPNLFHIPNGQKLKITIKDESISILGLGKVFSPKVYYDQPKKKKIESYYTRAEVDRACSVGPVDILLTHEAGRGMTFGTKSSVSDGINNICYATRPKIHFHGRYNTYLDYSNPTTNTRTIALKFNQVLPIEFKEGSFSFLHP